MSEIKSEQLGFIDSRGWLVRAGLIVAALLAITGAYYGLRWQLGQLLAESFSPASENAAQTADAAVDLAPRSPYTHSIAAKVQQSKILTDILAESISDQENAVRNSPYDFRYWLDLGRLREQSGERESGEAALRRAVNLAPNHAYPRWLLGNLLLRGGKTDEAMAEFRRVAANHSTLRQQVFYLIWESSGGNAEQIKQNFGDTPAVRASLATFYAGKNLPVESVQMWQSLNADDKTEYREAGKNALKANYEKLNFHAAAYFAKDLGTENAEVGKITNGGFEDDIGKSADAIFGWHVDQIKSIDVSLDLRQPKEGKRALRLTFNGYAEPTLQAAPQAVAVEPNTKYRLNFWLRTENLKSAGTPVVEIVDIKTLKTLGATQPFAAASDWQNVRLDFTAPPDAQAVLLRITRQFCGANCPILGAVWLDDFRLEKIETGKR